VRSAARFNCVASQSRCSFGPVNQTVLVSNPDRGRGLTERSIHQQRQSVFRNAPIRKGTRSAQQQLNRLWEYNQLRGLPRRDESSLYGWQGP
jgi:hypothetical protein